MEVLSKFTYSIFFYSLLPNSRMSQVFPTGLMLFMINDFLFFEPFQKIIPCITYLIIALYFHDWTIHYLTHIAG